jgi:hypothetical protein
MGAHLPKWVLTRRGVASELIIASDDPTTPAKTLDAMAYTIWDE